MDEVTAKIERLRKAVKEAGIVFHSPHSPTVADSVRAVRDPAFEGASYKANTQQLGEYNALPHQKKLIEHLSSNKFDPKKGLTLRAYSGHVGGLHSKGTDAMVQDFTNHEGKPTTYFSKKNPEMHPDERKSWGIDDRKMSVAQREVAYHNLAHNYFGLGEHVPEVILHNDDKDNQYTVQKWHPDHEMGDGKMKMVKSLKDFHDKGHFPKVAVMDNILGNTDRHMGNVLFDKNSNGVKFIDNGMSFVSKGRSPVPAYYTHRDYSHLFNGKITPEFQSWVKGLRPEKFEELLDQHGVPDDAKEMAMKRLEQTHKAVANSKDHNEFFNKLKRGIF